MDGHLPYWRIYSNFLRPVHSVPLTCLEQEEMHVFAVDKNFNSIPDIHFLQLPK